MVKGGFEVGTQEADIGKEAEKQWKKETRGQFKGKGHQKARGKA